ncbi:MAG TPA: polyprenol monophosphomannose synthase [Candidatus Aminicenantes bacterium]|nr:polyprenol monophosphomannose synthase [Candidatus Aminicenantes bacterium]
MDTVIVIPTLNEAENLVAIGRALLALPVAGLRLLIVDDDSPDGTGRIADEFAREAAGRVSVLHRRGPHGLGRAYLDGFRQALRDGAEAIVQMDADFSHAPADVPRLLERLGECDVAVGSRYVTGGSVDHSWQPSRRLLSRWAKVYSRGILGFRTQDVTAGFKCWRREALERVLGERIRSGGYQFQIETAYLCERLGLRVAEVPILFSERQAGRSKMNWRVKLEAAVGVFRILVWHRRVGPGR